MEDIINEKVNNPKTPNFFRKNWMALSAIILLLGLSGFLWLSKETALKKQSMNFEAEKTQLIQTAEMKLDNATKKQLELMMRTFAWAVRGEMTRDNLEQVDQFFKKLVKEEKINEIILTDKTGKILISSNKKSEGQLLPEEYGNELLSAEQVTITSNENIQIAGVPIMSLDSRLGTLIILYKKDSLDIK